MAQEPHQLFDFVTSVGTSPHVRTVVDKLAEEGGIEERGAVFTRVEVVDFILDLAGYTSDQPLYERRILEPALGKGSFLLPIVARLLDSATRDQCVNAAKLRDAIRGVELHKETFNSVKILLLDKLRDAGLSANDAVDLANHWLLQGDFLLTDIGENFDFAVGNPPYVRQEAIPDALLPIYRQRYQTMYDRADLYIAFIERSLSLLASQGVLALICADRWIKNKYGGPLRKLVSEQFHLRTYVDMLNARAFESDVIAYPAITVISRESGGCTRIAHEPELTRDNLARLARALVAIELPKEVGITEVENIVNGAEPWLVGSTDQTAVIRRLERDFPTIEGVGCKVGIGVATGADEAFIGDYTTLPVEADRKLPLVMTRDIRTGEVVWQGKGVINPFRDDGKLVNLENYPLLREYLNNNRDIVLGRHCAKKTPANWYRTIDRIFPELTNTPKLLIPDIRGEAAIVYEDGHLYPHHNLYFITSRLWHLRALQAVLLSLVTRLFIASYSTRMHGGCIRFQAQYLRRLRLPAWETVDDSLRAQLIAAGTSRDAARCNSAVFELYNLTRTERGAVGGTMRKGGQSQ
jgi:Eco57I restriction-modification methylase/TaqI-like C-terminal specificity domain